MEILENAYLVCNLHQNIQTITNSTSKLAKIVDAFKYYSSKPENNHQQRPSNIESTVEMALSLLSKQISPGINIVKKYDSILTILCNPDEVKNLASSN